MTTIHAITNDQVLTATILPKVAANNINSVRFHVEFDATWDDHVTSAVFYTSYDHTPYEMVLVDGYCLVPHEVLGEAGRLFISVKGVTSSGKTKTSTLISYKILPGTPSLITSDPTENVYNQLMAAYGSVNKAVSVERARINNLVTNGGTAGDDEVVDARVGEDGTLYNSLSEAIHGQVKPLKYGRFGLAALLPSSRGIYPTISTKDKTFSVGGDTLIISDRLPSGWVSLYPDGGNGSVTWGSEITSSAICFYYDITNNKLVARAYNDFVDEYNYILIATLRVGLGTTEGKSWAICSCPIYVDGYLSTEVNTIGGFVALLPPMHNTVSNYPKFSTETDTLTIPHDTLIVDPRLSTGYVSLRDESGNNSICVADFTSSAICIYYSIKENKLTAFPYNSKVNFADYLLICTIRRKVATDANVAPMVFASCPVWIDDRLSTDPEKIPSTSIHDTVKAINHRGYCEEAPENTLSAFRLSKKKGFTYVECDISFTSDGYAVLLHDSTVDRTSNGTGSIANMTLAQVRALDFGSWKSEKYAGEQIPRFEEFLVLCKHLGLHPYIELKDGTEAQIKALVKVVNMHGMKGKVTWISFNSTYLSYIKAVDPKARLGYVVSAINATTINVIKNTLQTGHNEVFIDCAYSDISTTTVQLCADAEIPLEVWTVNTESEISTLNMYVSGVTSDSLIAGNIFYNKSIGG